MLYIMRRKIGVSEIMALLLVLCAVLLRVVLIARGWPDTESDEGTMGLAAMHIAFKGELPIFFYGQNYMGMLEAYIGALLFHLMGVSVLSLRVGLLPLFTLFLISMYILTRLLYNKNFALLVLLFLSFGTFDILVEQLRAVGGALETLLFGSILTLLASWLAITSSPGRSPGHSRWRLSAFSGWGLSAGLGLWSHMLTVPFILLTGLLLILFCRQEMRGRLLLFLSGGFLLGAFPLLYHSLTVSPAHNVFATAWQIQQAAGNTGSYTFSQQLIGTGVYTLPMATGFNPLCTYKDLPFSAPMSSHILQCSILQGGWSLGYVTLLVCACCLCIFPLWKLWRLHTSCSAAERALAIIYCSRLVLLLAAALTLLLYVHSPLSALKPWSTRYLIGLLVATPAVLWPLWRSLSVEQSKVAIWLNRSVQIFRMGLLVLVSIVLLMSTSITLNTLPAISTVNQQQEKLVQHLLQRHITHVYTGYWLCYRIMFQSREQIICSIPDGLVQPGADRYTAYRIIVSADPHAAYMFANASPDDIHFAKSVLHSVVHYNVFLLDGYHIYQPSLQPDGA